jgi:hypothetical protein
MRVASKQKETPPDANVCGGLIMATPDEGSLVAHTLWTDKKDYGSEGSTPGGGIRFLLEIM